MPKIVGSNGEGSHGRRADTSARNLDESSALAAQQTFLMNLAKAAAASRMSPLEPAPLHSGASSNEGADTDDMPNEPEPTTEESLALHQNQHNQVLIEHRQQPRDPKWASVAEGSFLRGVSALTGFPGTPISVDCRTTLCTAEIEWPDYRSATGSYGAVVQTPYEENCASEILLPPPTDPSRAYRATAVFRCPERRKQ